MAIAGLGETGTANEAATLRRYSDDDAASSATRQVAMRAVFGILSRLELGSVSRTLRAILESGARGSH